MVLVCASRNYSVNAFNTASVVQKSQQKWFRLALLGNLGGALIWAMPSVFLFPPQNESVQVFIAFVVGGMAAGALTSLAFSKTALHLFLAIALVPLFMRFAVSDMPFALVMAFMIFLGYLMTLISGLKVHRDLVNLIALKIDNEQQKALVAQSERQYGAIVNQAADAYFLTTEKGLLVDANQQAESATGYNRAQFRAGSMNIQEILIMEDGSPCTALWASLGPDEIMRFPCFLRNAEKQLLPVDSSARAIVLHDEIRISLFVRDESEHQLQQRKLQHTREIVDFLLDNTPLGYIATDDNGRVIDWNRSAENIFGYRKEEMLNQYPQDYLLHKEVLPEVETVWQYIVLTKGSAHSVNNNIHKNGRTITCKWFTTPIVNLDNKITGMSSFVLDITQAVQSENALKAAKQQAEQANQAKTAFLSRMSHELRTPLNAILGYAQLLQMDASELSDMHNDNVQHINTAGNHLLSLINDLLDISALEAGKLKVALSAVPLEDVMTEALSNIKVQAIAKSITINHVSTDSKHLINAYRQRLLQVLLNLLSNAVKYNTDGGHIDVGVEIKASQHIRITISDTGRGIKDEEMGTLFTPFERFHEDHRIEGTGIGLSIAKKLVALMDGNIGVTSTFGKGSCFWVEFALHPDEYTETTELR